MIKTAFLLGSPRNIIYDNVRRKIIVCNVIVFNFQTRTNRVCFCASIINFENSTPWQVLNAKIIYLWRLPCLRSFFALLSARDYIMSTLTKRYRIKQVDIISTLRTYGNNFHDQFHPSSDSIINGITRRSFDDFSWMSRPNVALWIFSA